MPAVEGFRGMNQIVAIIYLPEARSKGQLGRSGSLSFLFVPPFLISEQCSYFIGWDSRCQVKNPFAPHLSLFSQSIREYSGYLNRSI